jgi:hypothetical protein
MLQTSEFGVGWHLVDGMHDTWIKSTCVLILGNFNIIYFHL